MQKEALLALTDLTKKLENALGAGISRSDAVELEAVTEDVQLRQQNDGKTWRAEVTDGYRYDVQGSNVIVSVDGDVIGSFKKLDQIGDSNDTKQVTRMRVSVSESSPDVPGVDFENSDTIRLATVLIIVAIVGVAVITTTVLGIALSKFGCFEKIKNRCRLLPTPFSYARKGKGFTHYVRPGDGEGLVPNYDIWVQMKKEDWSLLNVRSGTSSAFTPSRLVADETVHFVDQNGDRQFVEAITENEDGDIIVYCSNAGTREGKFRVNSPSVFVSSV